MTGALAASDWLVAALAVAVTAGIVGLPLLQRRQVAEMVAAQRRMLDTPGLESVTRPFGFSDGDIAKFHELPWGARNHGPLWPVQTTITVELAGKLWDLPACAFEWWWEVYRTIVFARIHWYRRRSLVAAMVLMPEKLQSPHSRIAQVDWTRIRQIPFGRDFKVESDSFNRRYHVRVEDEGRAVRLLGPTLQEHLQDIDDLEVLKLKGPWLFIVMKAPRGGFPFRFGGARSFDVDWPHGTPARAQPVTLARIVEALDQARLALERIPQSYWRSLPTELE